MSSPETKFRFVLNQDAPYEFGTRLGGSPGDAHTVLAETLVGNLVRLSDGAVFFDVDVETDDFGEFVEFMTLEIERATIRKMQTESLLAFVQDQVAPAPGTLAPDTVGTPAEVVRRIHDILARALAHPYDESDAREFVENLQGAAAFVVQLTTASQLNSRLRQRHPGGK